MTENQPLNGYFVRDSSTNIMLECCKVINQQISPLQSKNISQLGASVKCHVL